MRCGGSTRRWRTWGVDGGRRHPAFLGAANFKPLIEREISASTSAIELASLGGVKVRGLAAELLHDGMVLDGWHRYTACENLRLNPRCLVLPESEDPVAFVISRNAKRRNLTAAQKATAVAQCQEWRPGAGRPKNYAPGAELSETPKPMTAAQMATAAGVSLRTVVQAKEVIAKAEPEVKEAVKAGRVSLNSLRSTPNPNTACARRSRATGRQCRRRMPRSTASTA